MFLILVEVVKMTIVFKDSEDLYFEFQDKVPGKVLPKPEKGINIRLLHLYALYRNAVFDSYKQKTDLAKDIKEYKFQFNLSKKEESDKDKHVYHYSVAASMGAMKEWKTDNKMKCYMAYEKCGERGKIIGFVHFEEKEEGTNRHVYIAQAGVSKPGCGIGRRLMECVLAHYPAGTEFKIATRVFNTEAKDLYEKRLKFIPLEEKEVKESMGLDTRYCGFKKFTSEAEIIEIKQKFVEETVKRKLVNA